MAARASGECGGAERDGGEAYAVCYHPATSYEKELVKQVLVEAKARVVECQRGEDVVLTWAKSADVDWPEVLEGRGAATAYYLRTGITRKAELARLSERRHAAALRELVPPTLVIESQQNDDDAAAMEEFDAVVCQGGVWVLKPSEGNRGRGLLIFDASKPEECECARGAVLQKPEVTYVLQRYIENPLLNDGRKFHIRLHVLCVGDICVYVHQNAVVLLSSRAYSNNLSDRAAHITNHCVQDAIKPERGDVTANIEMDLLQACGHMWRETKAARSAFPSGPEQLHAWLFDALCSAAASVVETALAGPPLGFFPMAGSSELFGMDFMVVQRHDKSDFSEAPFELRLLEVNSDPSMAVFGKQQFLLAQCKTLLRDTARLVIYEAARHVNHSAALAAIASIEPLYPNSGFRNVLTKQRSNSLQRLRALKRLMGGLHAARERVSGPAIEETDISHMHCEQREASVATQLHSRRSHAMVRCASPGGDEVANYLRSGTWHVVDADSTVTRERAPAPDRGSLLYGIPRNEVDWTAVLNGTNLCGVLFRGDVLFSPATLNNATATISQNDWQHRYSLPALPANALLHSDDKHTGIWRLIRPATERTPSHEDVPRNINVLKKRLKNLALCAESTSPCEVDVKQNVRGGLETQILRSLEVQMVDFVGIPRVICLVLAVGRPLQSFCHEVVQIEQPPEGCKDEQLWKDTVCTDILFQQRLANTFACALSHASMDSRPTNSRLLALENTFELMWCVCLARLYLLATQLELCMLMDHKYNHNTICRMVAQPRSAEVQQATKEPWIILRFEPLAARAHALPKGAASAAVEIALR